MKQRYTESQVIDALHQTHGLVSLAAQLLRCDPETIFNYCKRYPAVQTAKEAARTALVDMAEDRLWQAVARGDAWAVAFTLKTLGRSRGYVERSEVTGRDGGPIEHAHIHLWESRLQEVHTRMAQQKAQRALEAGLNGQDHGPAE